MYGIVEALRVWVACFLAANRNARRNRGPSFTGADFAGPSFVDLGFVDLNLTCRFRITDFCLTAGTPFASRSRLFFSPASQQIGADERLQVAIEHAVHVAHLGFGAVILDHAVGLQDVGANLRAEVVVEF